MLKHLRFPLLLKTIVTSIANDFTVYDSNSNEIFYVKQKLIPIKDDILIFSDQKTQQLIYRIVLEGPLLSFSGRWAFYNIEDELIGKLHQPNIKTNWSGYYEVLNFKDEIVYKIHEDDPFVKVWNSRLNEIPILGFLSGYFFNPSYSLMDTIENPLFQLKKEPAFLGNKFSLKKLSHATQNEDELCVLAMFMLLLQENSDG